MASVVATPIVASTIVPTAVVASISAVPIGTTIVSRPWTGTIYQRRRTIDDRRRCIDDRWPEIDGTRYTDADAYRHLCLYRGGQHRDKRCCDQKTNELLHLLSPHLESAIVRH
jgi:hypothetical protein